jgi:hypothetical protein
MIFPCVFTALPIVNAIIAFILTGVCIRNLIVHRNFLCYHYCSSILMDRYGPFEVTEDLHAWVCLYMGEYL